MCDASGRVALRRPPGRLYEHLEWDAELLVQRADHVKAERALARKYLRHTRATAEAPLEIAARRALLVHDEQDRVDRFGQRYRPATLLVDLDHQRQKLQLIGLGRARSRVEVEQLVELGQRRGVFLASVDDVRYVRLLDPVAKKAWY